MSIASIQQVLTWVLLMFSYEQNMTTQSGLRLAGDYSIIWISEMLKCTKNVYLIIHEMC